MTITHLTEIVNGIGLVVFLVLLGSILALLGRRVLLYHDASLALPVILKRGVVLFAALAFLFGQIAFLRVLGVNLTDPGYEVARLGFILETNIVIDAALIYWLKTELFDVDNPDKP